jgi:hypothetical protein
MVGHSGRSHIFDMRQPGGRPRPQWSLIDEPSSADAALASAAFCQSKTRKDRGPNGGVRATLLLEL